MELTPTRRKVVREFTGPTPHSVAILAKHGSKRNSENEILVRRKKEEEKRKAEALVLASQKVDFKNEWELVTNKKIVGNIIQKGVESLLQQQQFSIEERRERLRRLLTSEEEQYMSEVASKQETMLERQARMRERARSLREKREKERLDFVEDKLEQRWREGCEDLRTLRTKVHLEEVTKDRGEQLRLKAEEKTRKDQDMALYAMMWKEDYLAKCKREEMEVALQIERNKEMLGFLNVQTAAKQKEKEELQKLKEKEAELLREEAALRAMEEERAKQEKKQKQEEVKATLNYSLKLKMKKRAKEVQEELALDMKMLEQMLTASTNEVMESLQHKNQLREEIKQYRQYLYEQSKEEERREKELDAIVTAEVERQWSKRLDHWKKEKQARKTLMQDVLDARKKQIEEKLAMIEQEKAKMEIEKAVALRNFEEHILLEKQQQEEKHKANLSYRNDLEKQIEYNELSKQFEKQQIQEEIAMCKEAEYIHQKRVRNALKNPNIVIGRVHPNRLALSGKALTN